MNKFEIDSSSLVSSQREIGPTNHDDLTGGTINERLARRGTALFGSMWTFYAFVIYGALGAIFVNQQATLLYWSNWIQLWSMPLLMVGGLVIGKASERRAQQTHEDASAILDKVQQIQVYLGNQDDRIAKLASDFTKVIRTTEDLNNSEVFHDK